MDFKKQKPSKNFQDYTGNKARELLGYLLDPYSPEYQNIENQNKGYLGQEGYEPGVTYDYSPKEKKRMRKGEDVLNILRERMKNAFMYNFLMGNQKPNFDFHREKFQTDSNLRKRSSGSAYDNY